MALLVKGRFQQRKLVAAYTLSMPYCRYRRISFGATSALYPTCTVRWTRTDLTTIVCGGDGMIPRYCRAEISTIVKAPAVAHLMRHGSVFILTFHGIGSRRPRTRHFGPELVHQDILSVRHKRPKNGVLRAQYAVCSGGWFWRTRLPINGAFGGLDGHHDFDIIVPLYLLLIICCVPWCHLILLLLGSGTIYRGEMDDGGQIDR